MWFEEGEIWGNICEEIKFVSVFEDEKVNPPRVYGSSKIQQGIMSTMAGLSKRMARGRGEARGEEEWRWRAVLVHTRRSGLHE